jgi:hypothetical protein
MVQVIECLPSKHNALTSIPSTSRERERGGREEEERKVVARKG